MLQVLQVQQEQQEQQVQQELVGELALQLEQVLRLHFRQR
jgi:hypothetical protein